MKKLWVQILAGLVSAAVFDLVSVVFLDLKLSPRVWIDLAVGIGGFGLAYLVFLWLPAKQHTPTSVGARNSAGTDLDVQISESAVTAASSGDQLGSDNVSGGRTTIRIGK